MHCVRLAWLLLAFSGSTIAADDDAAWIERFVGDAVRAEAQAAQEARSVAFSELSGMVGVRVRLFLRGGFERRGTVDEVRGDRVRLKGSVKGGYFKYDLARQQIVRIEKDSIR